jgi:hypothetical protein
VPLAIHSDAPVTPLAPLFTAWCAVNRLSASGQVLGRPAERIGACRRDRRCSAPSRWPVPEGHPRPRLGLDGEIGSIEVRQARRLLRCWTTTRWPGVDGPMALKDLRRLGHGAGAAELAAADLLVLSKADLVEADALAGLRRTLPDVPVVDAEQGQLPIDVVLGLPAGRHPAPLAGAAGERFVSRSAGLPAPQDVDAIAQRLTQAGSGVLRAKGLLTGADGRRVLLQVVGRQAQLSPAPSTATGPDRLAVIGLLGLYDGAPWS